MQEAWKIVTRRRRSSAASCEASERDRPPDAEEFGSEHEEYGKKVPKRFKSERYQGRGRYVNRLAQQYKWQLYGEPEYGLECSRVTEKYGDEGETQVTDFERKFLSVPGQPVRDGLMKMPDSKENDFERTFLNVPGQPIRDVLKKMCYSKEKALQEFAMFETEEWKCSRVETAVEYTLPVVGSIVGEEEVLSKKLNVVHQKKPFTIYQLPEKFRAESNPEFKEFNGHHNVRRRSYLKKWLRKVASGAVKLNPIGEYVPLEQQIPSQFDGVERLPTTCRFSSRLASRHQSLLEPAECKFGNRKLEQYIELDLGSTQVVRAISVSPRTMRTFRLGNAMLFVSEEEERIGLGQHRYFEEFEVQFRENHGRKWTNLGRLRNQGDNFTSGFADLAAFSSGNGLLCRYLRVFPIWRGKVGERAMSVSAWGRKSSKEDRAPASPNVENVVKYVVHKSVLSKRQAKVPHNGSRLGGCRCCIAYDPYEMRHRPGKSRYFRKHIAEEANWLRMNHRHKESFLESDWLRERKETIYGKQRKELNPQTPVAVESACE